MMYYSKTQPGPTQELLVQRDKDETNKNYDIAGVREKLYDDFNGICYICGYSNPSNAIEHFRPHRTVDRTKMFDWNNLFYACEHCNGIKSDNFENLLDCTEVKKIDGLLKVEYDASKAKRQKVSVIDINSNSPETIELIRLVFSINTTPKRSMGSITLEKQVAKELRNFKLIVDEYMRNPTQVNENLLKEEVNNKSDFSAFKRWKVRLNSQNYPNQLQSWFVN